MKVAVLGASGYTGLELLRVLLRHPEFEIAAVTSEQRAGRPVGEAFPSLRGRLDLSFEVSDPAGLAGRVELAFTALPHSASARSVAALRDWTPGSSLHALLAGIAGVLFAGVALQGRALERGEGAARGPHAALAAVAVAIALVASVAGFTLLP